MAAFNDLIFNQEANDTAAEFVRGKIREIVKDPVDRRIAGAKRPSDRHQADLRRYAVLRDL